MSVKKNKLTIFDDSTLVPIKFIIVLITAAFGMGYTMNEVHELSLEVNKLISKSEFASENSQNVERKLLLLNHQVESLSNKIEELLAMTNHKPTQNKDFIKKHVAFLK